MAPMEVVEGKNETPREELPPASPGQKIIVAFAGPLFSFGLAFVFACLVWCVGKPVGYSEGTTTIGYAIPTGPAAKAGVEPGDVIQSINGEKTRRWIGIGDGVTWNIITSTQVPMKMEVLRNGQPMTFNITPELDPEQPQHWYQRATPPKIQILPAEKDIVVGKVLDFSPAAVAGIQKGDRLIELNGVHLYCSYPLYQILKTAPNDPIKLTIVRGDQTLTKVIQPEKPISPKDLPKELPQTDIGIEYDNTVDVVQVYPTPWNQISESVNMVRSTLTALFTPHSNVGPSQLSGPVGIMNLFFVILSSDNGWKIALWFAVVINVNLAILNLFPLPILDGGHITLSIIEWIRRRPLSMGILEPLQTACALFLMGYMLFITFYDAQDSYKMASSGDQEYKFAPK
jgi:regulator of sigma E protease